MADEFKIASAFVEVNLRDNTSGDEQQIRARLEGSGPIDLETALQDPKNVQLIKDKIEAGPAAKIRADVDVDDSQLRDAKGRFVAAGSDAGDGFTKGSSDAIKNDKKTESAAESVAKRAEAKFSALQFLGLSVGLPAAAAIGAAGVAGALGGVGLLFGVLAATAASSNAQVGVSFADLANTVEDEAKAMAAPLSGEFISAIDRVRATFLGLEPEINSAMIGGARDVGILTDGVIEFAQNAMPGMVIAVNSGQAPLRGFDSLLSSTGTGVTDFFRNLSTGSQGAETDLTILGGAARDLLGFLGTVFANLANNGGPALQSFRTDLQLAEQAIINLTRNGSALYSFFGGAAGAVGGMLNVLQAVASILAALPAPLTRGAGALLAYSKVASAFGVSMKDAFKSVDSAGSKLDQLKGYAGRAVLALGLVSAAASALATPVQHDQTTVDGLTNSLNKWLDTGKASGDLSKLFGGNLKDLNDSFTILNETGLSKGIENLTDWTGNLLGVDSRLDDATSRVKQLDDALANMVTSGQGQAASDAVAKIAQQTGQSVDQVIAKLPEYKAALDGAAQSNEQAANAMSHFDLAAVAASSSTTALNGAFAALRGSSSDASAQVSALQLVLDQITGRAPTHEEAIQSINDTLRNMADQLGKNIDKTQGFGAALLNADGTVNTATANGSALQNSLVQLQGGFAAAGQSIQGLVAAGVPLSAAQQQVQGELDASRQKFIDNARQMGLTAAQANELADKYGLIPNLVETAVLQPGMLQAITNAGVVREKITAIPNQWTVQVNGLTAQAEANLTALGYHVTHLPNGQVWVTAPNAPAVDAQLNYVARDRKGTITMIVRQDGSVRLPNGNVMSAQGNLVMPFADGGFAGLTPMASIAQVVPPDTWRVVGDNLKLPEAYIPLDPRSQRSQAILDRANQIMRGGDGAAQPTQVEQHFHIYPSPGMDEKALASSVSAEVGWQMRGR